MINNRVFLKSDSPKNFFKACGAFGEISGTIERDGNKIINKTDTYKMVCRYTKNNYGVYTRQDTFQNISDKPITVNCLKSVFVFDGGEYEGYSQYNSWQTESAGKWQDLSTGIHLSGRSARTSMDATPFLSLWNKQTCHGAAFHLVPDSAWEITARMARHEAMFARLFVEIGILEYNLNVTLYPGEKIELPEIIFYGYTNKTDMDCYKLHRYMNERYPRKSFPIIYNSWLYNFDRISYEILENQVSVASEMGFEYFVIDAGWFGKGGDWSSSVGDWSENLTGGFCGRMREFADLVRANGMKFGLWFEVERADVNSDAVKNHRDWFVEENGTFLLDFANAEARENMLSTIFGMIEKYDIEYIKFDFNADLYYDCRRSAFLGYHAGHKAFMAALRERYPDLYITNCASGGARMNLAGCRNFDSFWPSDNESPYDEMRMYKESLLRLPPQVFEKYTCIQTINNFKPGGYNPESEKIIACNDATWYDVAGVHPSWLKAYFTGSPIGFSCNLTLIAENIRKQIAEYITDVKKNRDFWIKAECRILSDAKELTVYEYSDKELKRNVIVAFFGTVMQRNICVYPVVDTNKTYLVNGEKISGAELGKNGIDVYVPQWKEAVQIEITEV